MRVMATAGRACARMRVGRDPRREERATDNRAFDLMAATGWCAVHASSLSTTR
ncbi:DUF6357 family protein [Kribbella speibonae]|uniref:DUF6357 family protein n=1 Tax=Kribbella speibonae TaxID=1572660 RepID=UPI003B847995